MGNCLPGMSCYENIRSSNCCCNSPYLKFPASCSDTGCYYNAVNVCYKGSDLTNIDAGYGDTLSDILRNINTAIGNIVVSSSSWGSITGTITNQTDLISYLSTNYYSSSNPNGYISNLSSFTTTNLAEGSNLYFTNARAISALTGQNISIFTNDAGYITSLSGALLTANNLSELTGTASTARTNLGITSIATVSPGTGVNTALAVNIGTAGSFIVNGGALGTPSSGTLTNATGLPPITGIVGWPANASGALTNDGAGNLSWTSAGGITGLTATRIPYATSATSIADDEGLTYDATNDILTVGSGNQSLRIHAGKLNTGGVYGDYNIFIGYNAGVLANKPLIDYNIGIGYTALSALTTGDFNITVGGSVAVQDGVGNTSIGYQSLNGVSSGDYNIGIGYTAGDNITTGDNNIIIGKSVDAQSATTSNQLSIQNAIFGTGNSSTGTTVASGNLGLWATTWGTSAQRVLSIGNGTAPTTSIADGIQVFSKDSSDGAANATLGLYTEQAVEAIGTFTPSHKLKIWINGVEYWIQLDAV